MVLIHLMFQYKNKKEFEQIAVMMTMPEQTCSCMGKRPQGWFEAAFHAQSSAGKYVTQWFYGTCCQECHLSAVWPGIKEEQRVGSELANELIKHTGWNRKNKGPRLSWYCPLCCFKYNWRN